ncbi:MAG TPA: DUF2080 family transposase-associated protein [Euryarchaeota archaeon]|nr:DUF2080 family transposase-associated protein [Euryarchaeota archaeon]
MGEKTEEFLNALSGDNMSPKKEEIIYKIVNESPVNLTTTGVFNRLPYNVFKNTERDYVKTALSRLVTKGKIKRVRQGVFASNNFPSQSEKSTSPSPVIEQKVPAKKRAARHKTTIILYKGVEMVEEVVGDGGNITLPEDWTGRTVKIVLF